MKNTHSALTLRFEYLWIWAGTFVCCSAVMAHFYGLGKTGTVIYPFRDRSDQILAVIETSAAATFVSSWVVWFGLRRTHRLAVMVLRTVMGTELSFAIYGFAGLQIAISDWHSPMDLFFRSTFFAEYNWITFIVVVGTITSCVAGLLVFITQKAFGKRSQLETVVLANERIL